MNFSHTTSIAWSEEMFGDLIQLHIHNVKALLQNIAVINIQLQEKQLPKIPITTLDNMAHLGVIWIMEGQDGIIHHRSQKQKGSEETKDKKKDSDKFINHPMYGRLPKEYQSSFEEVKKKNNNSQEHCLMTVESKTYKKMLGMTKHTWLADSGASSHYVNNDDGMFDVKIQDSTIMIGNLKQMTSTKTGSIKMTGQDSNTGQDYTFVMKNVQYVPELWVNLLSIPAALQQGYKLGNNGLKIHLTKDNFKLTFDKIYQTKRGYICGVELHPHTNEFANAALSIGHKLDTKEAHGMLGHMVRTLGQNITVLWMETNWK